MSNQPQDPRPQFYAPQSGQPAPWSGQPGMPSGPPRPMNYGPSGPQQRPTQAPPFGTPNSAYGPPQVFAPRPAKKRAGIAGLLAVAVLSAGIGGGAALGVDRYVGGPDSSTSAVSSTQVVQADASNPDWAKVASSVSEAVVAIQVSSRAGSGQGSGVVLDADGTIVTNNHVIEGGGADAQIRVIVANEAHEAKVVGTDPSTDLAVIRLVNPPAALKTVEFADSTKLVVGQPVMAIGNPLGLSDTVTTGIVSALNRPVTTREVSSTVGDQGNGAVVTAAIQTSAAINPGNSGGALLDASGKLVGITSSIATLSGGSSAPSGSIGIGFAIGSEQVRYITDQLIESGTAKHAQLGVSAQDHTESPLLGAQVAEVVKGSAASEAGIAVGDVITAVDGVNVTSSESLVALVRNARVGQELALTLQRGGAEESITVTLGSAEG